jgi:hypothetical protein
MDYIPPKVPASETKYDFVLREVDPHSIDFIYALPGDFLAIFEANKAKLIKQGQAIQRAPGSSDARLQHLFKEVERVLPGMTKRADIMTAYCLACGFTSAEIGKFIVKHRLINDPLKVIKILQASGMLPSQVNSALGAMGGTYATYTNKVMQNVAVQSVVSFVTYPVSEVEKQVRDIAQPVTSWISDTGETIGNAIVENLNPSNW